MSDLPNVEINNKETIDIILINLEKLLQRRGYIEELTDSMKKSMHVDKNINIKTNKINLNVNFMNQEVKNISSNSPIDEYLSKNIDTHKILIVSHFSKKTYKQVTEEYTNAEIFSLHEFLEDIPSKNFIPIHTLIEGKDREELLKSFSMKELGRIYNTDIMARYYNAKLNDIFRISRPNISSGYSIYYRLVVPGSLEIFQ
jgi:DNA-directed RNA polymerase subunit H (RpoH/RPB5)